MNRSLIIFFGFLLIMASTTAQAESPTPNLITIFPYHLGSLNPKDYRYTPPAPPRNVWQKIDKILQQHNLRLTVSRHFSQETFNNSVKIICLNVPHWIPGAMGRISECPQQKSILITFEPPVVLPSNFSKHVLNSFGRVLTWDDSLVDNKKFFKFNYYDYRPLVEDIPPYSQKNFLTQISRNSRSSHPLELYSERLRAIRYFEKRPDIEFEFYGTKWADQGYRNYKGSPPNKLAVLKNYKFSLCYENTKNVKGYITEKILDCFAAGCVPIYWGAPNITDYIPANCFISRVDFSSLDELVDFLQKIDEKTYNQYLQNIKNFLNSRQAQAFSQEAFIQAVLLVCGVSDPPLLSTGQ